MLIRPAELGDAEAIRQIYNVEVRESVVTFDMEPWTLDQQVAWLRRHSGVHPAVVAAVGPGGQRGETGQARGAAEGVGAHGQVVLGFGSLSPFRGRPAYATTVENSVYVDRAHRGAGVGRALLEELIRLAATHGFHTVIARVVGHNEASIALHETCGFTLVGVEREVGRKHRQWLDVVELQRML